MNSALYRVVAATAALGSLAAHEPASAAPTQPEASSPQTNVSASPKAAGAIAPTPMATPDLPTVDFSGGISNGVSNSEPVSVAASVPSVTNSNAVPFSQLPPLPPVSSTPVASPQPTQPPAEPLPTVGVTPTPVLSNPAPTQTAVQPGTGTQYRVIVPAATAEMQQRVKTIAPDAFRTTLNGQTVMQVGLFREQSAAETLKQSFDRQNLQASILSIRQTVSPPSPSPSSPSTPMLYRVIVPATSAQVEQRVKAIAPDAFRTTLNGQTVMQAGLFREQSTAANLQQSLTRQNLQASIVSISETSVNLPQTPPSGGSTGVPRERIVVVIDPGHGGRDPGAVGIGGLREKDVVLSISRQVANLLEREGIQVVMTRADDRALELSTRVQMAQRANANYFVSIHANALSMSRPDVDGVETFYHRSGRELAQSIQNSIMQSVNMNNRGVKQANFYVLRNTSMPSVLVEVGFVTGRDDAAKLRDASFQTTMAGAIARGIVQNVRSR